jgi:predicted ribosomally synthesized peptide with nif11-like leader
MPFTRAAGKPWRRFGTIRERPVSHEQLRQFLARVQADSELKRLVQEAVTADAVASLAQERGYAVSGSDILRFSGQSAAGVRVTRIDHPGEYPGRYV